MKDFLSNCLGTRLNTDNTVGPLSGHPFYGKEKHLAEHLLVITRKLVTLPTKAILMRTLVNKM